MKRKEIKSALELGDLVLQDLLKSLMYVDSSFRGDPKKDKLIDNLNFKNYMSLQKKTTSKLFVGVICKKKNYYSSIIF